MCEHAASPGRLARVPTACRPLRQRVPARGARRAGAAHRRCGSCARRAARCRSTCGSARASGCSSRAWTPSWSSRSPCSRCAGTAWTRPSSSPTSCCRSRRSASTSTSSPASARWWPTPVRTLADVEAIPDLEPEHVAFITEAVRGLVGELGGTPLIGFAGAPFTVASYLVEGGPSKEHALHQGDDVRRPRRLGRADAQDRRHLGGLPRGPGRRRAPRPSSSSTRGPVRSRRPTTRRT